MIYNEKFSREIPLIGEESYNKIKSSLIVLLGLGGVGSYTFEALVRAGVENFIIVDKDVIDITNLNRQLMATDDTVGKDKVIVYANRAKKINNEITIIGMKLDINTHVKNILDMQSEFKNITCVYVIDCIDDLNAKIELITYCKNNNIKIISSMGTANHINTENIIITDISKTKYCPVAKIIRKKLKDINIDKLDVLFINEEPIKTDKLSTISYVPSICGLKIAEYVIRNII